MIIVVMEPAAATSDYIETSWVVVTVYDHNERSVLASNYVCSRDSSPCDFQESKSGPAESTESSPNYQEGF